MEPLDPFSPILRAANATWMPVEPPRHSCRQQLEGALRQFSSNLLDFTKIEAKVIKMRDEIVDLTTLVDSVIDRFGRQAVEKVLTFVAIIQPETPTRVMGDAGRIRQVLVNLVGNALKFTTSGAVVIRVEGNEGRLSFQVTSTVQGMTKEEIATVYEPFDHFDISDSEHHCETGFGLTICKRLVDLMQGSMDVTHRRGEGCHFWFRIPFRPAPVFQDATIDRPQQAAVAWVADPSSEVSESVQCVCQSCGWEVQTFSSAQTLLHALEDHSKPCDLLFIDGGLISPSFAQSLANVWRTRGKMDSHVIVTQATSDSLELKVPGWQFISRPWRISTLMAICRENAVPAPSQSADNPAPLLLRVLVAEDNDINGMVLMTALNWLGCRSTLAANGKKAVELFQTEKFDVILMDCQMPIMDGYEATRQIRQLERERMGGKPVRIVAITAIGFNENRQRFLLAGIDEHLPKPFTLERLRAVLQCDRTAEISQSPSATTTPISSEFEELIRMVGPGDTAKLGTRWLQDANEGLQAIRVALPTADWSRIAKEAHAIAGTAALFGLVEVVRSAKLVEYEVLDTQCLSAPSLEIFAGAIDQAQQALKLRIQQLELSQ